MPIAHAYFTVLIFTPFQSALDTLTMRFVQQLVVWGTLRVAKVAYRTGDQCSLGRDEMELGHCFRRSLLRGLGFQL